MTMTSKFTPGPWLSKPAFYDDGSVVLGTPAAHRKRLDANGRFQEADAHLIAAAPDMFDLLCELDDYFDNRADADYQGEEEGFVPSQEMKHLTAIRELLAKAEGRTR